MRKRISQWAMALAVITASVLGVSAPAFAAYDDDWCRVYGTSCSTDSIPAHSSQHWVMIRVEANHICAGGYKVYDSGNGALVASGPVALGSAPFEKTIYGLYGTY